MVLLEDTGALIGLVLALGGVGLTVLTGNPVWDGVGTVAIGALLGVIAVVLMTETHSLLIGEGCDSRGLPSHPCRDRGDPHVDRVIHLRTQYLGRKRCSWGKDRAAPKTDLRMVAATIDAAEAAIRAAVPAARVIYLEPDLDRASK